MRVTVRIPLVLLVLVVGLVVAGCGAEDEPASAPSTPASDAAEVGDGDGEPVTAALEVTMEGIGDKDGIGPPVPAGMRCTKSIPASCSATVACPAGEGEELADARDVCAWLATTGLDLLTEEVPEAQACTMIYGGPATATVTGSVGDTKVDADFSRQDGCAIARWDAAAPLWDGKVAPPAEPDATPPAPADPDTPVSSDDDVPREVEDPPEAFPLG
jgi:hypothetical protein